MLPSDCLLVALSCFTLPTCAETQSPALVEFGNETLELRFDGETGELRRLTYRPLSDDSRTAGRRRYDDGKTTAERREDGGATAGQRREDDGRRTEERQHGGRGMTVLENAQGLADCDLNLDGKWLSGQEPSAWRYQSHEVETLADGQALHVTSTLNGWRRRVTYRLFGNRPVLMRSAVFVPPENAKGRVNGLRLILSGLRLGNAADATYTLLSNYPPVHTRFNELTPGRVVDEMMASNSGHFVFVHNAAERLSLPVTYYSDQEYSHATVIEGEHSITVIGHQSAIVDAQAGRPIAFGSQLLCIAEGDRRAGLQAAQGLYDLVGLRPPERTQELAARAVIYSAHPGGTIDSGFRDVGGYRELAKMLPYYADLGVNMLWLLPIWHGYIYAPDDYSKLDPQFGTEEELKVLVDRAHSLGIRVLGDLIPHGPLDTSKLHEQHPDWICKNADGSFQYWWGCLYCDYAHPGWQGFMGEHAADWVRRVGLDGYRVDCAGGGPPNWRPHGDNRPTMSGLAGGLGVLAAARKAMEAEKPEVFLLAESAGPPFFRSANFTYDWPFLFTVAPALLQEGAAVWVPRVSEWLEQQQYSFPRGARQIMTLENHDTVRAVLKFGVGTQRALLALAAFSHATPFLYHDQEIGYGLYLKRLYALRREYDELVFGEPSYTLAPASNPAVLTILRPASLVAINFSGDMVRCTVDLSRSPHLDPKRRYVLWDALLEAPLAGGKALRPSEMRAVKLTLLPYSPAVLLIRSASESSEAAPRASKARGAGELWPEWRPLSGSGLKVTRTGERVVVSNGLYEAAIGPEAGGLIESLSARGRTLLGPMRLGTAGAPLWPEGEFELGPTTSRALSIRQEGKDVVVTVTGAIMRTSARQEDPALDYEAAYRFRHSSSEISWMLKLTPRIDIEGAGSLVTTLSFPGATRWAANTFEGLLYDELIARRRDDQAYHSMNIRPHSDRLFSSESLPLDPDNGFIAAEWPDGTGLVIRDIRGWAVDVPRAVVLKERLGDATGLHARVEWANPTKPLSLVKGVTYELSQTLQIARVSEGRPQRKPPQVGAAGLQLWAEGSRYIVQTRRLRAAICRSRGGSLEELSLLTGGGSTIAGSNVYTDYGIYPEWTDPSGNKQRRMAPADLDVECVPTIDRQPDRLRLTFEGVLRDASWFGRPIPEPRTQYRVTYEFEEEAPGISVECAVSHAAAKPGVRAFLAQTLRLPNAGAWEVYVGEPPRLVASGKPPGPGNRVWQSAASPLTDADRPRIVVEMPGRTSVEFTDFTGLQSVQNLFYFQGKTDATLFVAFLDGRPVDLTPEWLTVRYRVTAGGRR